ncbi:MAG: DUF441 family protein [Halanaerobium sp.]|nr:DUF441 family protein [Halanaerobium sp.]
MDAGFLILLLTFALGLLASSSVITYAAGILLLLKAFHLSEVLPLLEKRSLELGLVFLVISVLIPLLGEDVKLVDLRLYCYSWKGIVAFIGGLLATRINFMGLELLQNSPYLIVMMILGVIVGINLGGIPVGPLMAGGLSAVMIFLLERIF